MQNTVYLIWFIFNVSDYLTLSVSFFDIVDWFINLLYLFWTSEILDFPAGTVVKNQPANEGDAGDSWVGQGMALLRGL